jgi:O-antigen/teichoic acid export membrane protein
MTRPAHSITSSGLSLLGSQYGLAVVNVAVSMVMLRLLSKPQFAVVATLEILSALVAFSDPGLNSVVVQRAPAGFKAGGDERSSLGLIKLALVCRLAALVVLGLVFILLGSRISLLFLKTTDYTAEIRVLVVGALLSATWESLQVVAQAVQDFKLIARWNLLGGITKQVLALLLFFPFGFWGYLTGLVASIALVNVAMAWSLRRYLWASVPAAPIGPTLRYAFPYFLRRFFRFGFLQFDLAAVGAMLPPEALAMYSVARRLAGYISQVTESFQTPILMRVASMRQESAEERGVFARKAMRYITLLIVPICALVAAASPWIMGVFGGAKYAAGWPILAVLAIGQILYALYSNQAIYVFVVRAPWATLLLDGLSGLLSFGSVPLIILSLGVNGVGLGQILGLIAGTVLARALLRAHREIRFDWESLRLLIVPLGVAVAVIVAGQRLWFRIWSVPIFCALAGAIFVLLLRPSLTEEDRRQIGRILPSWVAGVGRTSGGLG